MELSAFQSFNCSKGVKKQPSAALSPAVSYTTEYAVKVFCDGIFLLLYDSCELNLNFSFCTIYLHLMRQNKCHEQWSHQSTYMFSSPIMQNAERILTISVIMLVCLGSIARASSSRLRSSPKILCSPYCERDNN